MWADELVARVAQTYRDHADAQRAAAMQAYMKDVAPFCGIPAAERRRLLHGVWRSMPAPDEAQVVAAAAGLRGLPEREFHYAGAETLGRWWRLLGPERLDTDVLEALLQTPWWDTVDLLGSEVINPMVSARPELVDVVWRWNGAGDQWLVRASIQHQRGVKAPDLELLFALCDPHTADRRFFVAKAIDWALRDATRQDVDAVARFVARHPELPPVALREVRRGIARAQEAPTSIGKEPG